MAFWSDRSGNEPKRNYRWVVAFKSPYTPASLVYALKKVDKPKAKIAEVTHKYLNHFFYYPGRLEWEAINMTFASLSGQEDTTFLVDRILKNAGYGVPSGNPNDPFDKATLGKRKFNQTLGNTINIQQLSADGVVIENWELSNPFFTAVNYGTLDYGNEEIVEISTTVRYDWAKLTTISAGAPPETAGIYPVGG